MTSEAIIGTGTRSLQKLVEAAKEDIAKADSARKNMQAAAFIQEAHVKAMADAADAQVRLQQAQITQTQQWQAYANQMTTSSSCSPYAKQIIQPYITPPMVQQKPKPQLKPVSATQTHDHIKCMQDNLPCPLHKPSPHPMHGMMMRLLDWDGHHLLTRMCQHNVEHLDPDSAIYLYHKLGENKFFELTKEFDCSCKCYNNAYTAIEDAILRHPSHPSIALRMEEQLHAERMKLLGTIKWVLEIKRLEEPW